jgi:hypothetical protein
MSEAHGGHVVTERIGRFGCSEQILLCTIIISSSLVSIVRQCFPKVLFFVRSVRLANVIPLHPTEVFVQLSLLTSNPR